MKQVLNKIYFFLVCYLVKITLKLVKYTVESNKFTSKNTNEFSKLYPDPPYKSGDMFKYNLSRGFVRHDPTKYAKLAAVPSVKLNTTIKAPVINTEPPTAYVASEAEINSVKKDLTDLTIDLTTLTIEELNVLLKPDQPINFTGELTSASIKESLAKTVELNAQIETSNKGE